MNHELKDGDMYAGRPVTILTEAEAALAPTAVDPAAVDILYGGKGSEQAKANMVKVRANRKKRTADE